MKRVRLWFRRLKIRNKMLMSSYIILSPIIILITVFSFRREYKELTVAENSECIRTIRAVCGNYDILLTNVTDLGTYICINDDVNGILKSELKPEYEMDSQIWFHKAPMKIIQDMVSLDGQVKTLAIYAENGIRPYLRCMDYSAYMDDLDKVRKTDNYINACQNVGKFIWQRVDKEDKETFSYNQNIKIVAYREMYDLSQKNKLGYLVIGASAAAYDKVCREAMNNENESICVYSPLGEVLSCVGRLSSKEAAQIIETIPQPEEKNVVENTKINGYIVYYIKSQTTGMTYYKFMPNDTLSALIKKMGYMDFLLLVGLLIGLFPITILITQVVIVPLHKLTAAMRRFKEGDFSQRVEIASEDEVGEAAQVFNEMVEDMKELIDTNYVLALKEKESELNALQAQINPHFLYNALDSLYWKCVDTEHDELGEDILALSDIFRLVLSRGNSVVLVSDEVKLLKQYLHLQASRFGRCFSYKLDVSDDCMDKWIPKLILQPFVENAVVHGFEESGLDFELVVSGEVIDNKLVFKVADNGVGMDEEQIKELWNPPPKTAGSGKRISKYAIKNVRERLDIFYKGNFELNIDSCVNKGTTVTVIVPKEGKQDEAFNS